MTTAEGQDTGIMNEPPVGYWLMGANEWRTGKIGRCRDAVDKIYLSHWEALSD